MQNNNQNAKNLAENLTNRNSVLSIFHKENFEMEALKMLSPKSYYHTYYWLYWFCVLASYALQIASAISEFSWFQSLLIAKIKTEIWLIIATTIIIVFLEITKYILISALLSRIFGIPRNYPYLLIIVALFPSALSMYASIIGGGKLAVDTEIVVRTEDKFDKEIHAIRGEISDIKLRNSWKGNTYIVGKELDLLRKKEILLEKTIAEKEKGIGKVNDQNLVNETQYQWLFGGLEIFYIICLLFKYHYTRSVALERQIKDPPTLPSESFDNSLQTKKYHLGRYANHKYAVRKYGVRRYAMRGNTTNSVSTHSVGTNTVTLAVVKCKNNSCHQVFSPNKRNHVFCSTKCHDEWHGEGKMSRVRMKRKNGKKVNGTLNMNFP